MKVPAVPEELVTFVQVLADDEDLRAWFESFSGLSEAGRGLEFQRLAAKMQTAGEHPDLVKATALLAAPQVYRGARAALEEALDRRVR